MGFGDLKSAGGLSSLNSYLLERSYIEGYQPSQADVAVFKAVSKPDEKYINLLRWYNHINSFSASEQQKFPGDSKKTVDKYGPGATPQNGDDDDVDADDLFGSDNEDDDEAERLKAERVAAYKAKKEKKPALIAKSSILLDVKPWDDETDMAEMERLVRSIEADGLLWGASKLVPVGYGIKKLQIGCVVEDDKIGTDFLEEEITKYEDIVQSVDIAAFNKI